MRVLLISANTERINMVTMPLGLALVAAATRRAGHDVSVPRSPDGDGSGRRDSPRHRGPATRGHRDLGAQHRRPGREQPALPARAGPRRWSRRAAPARRRPSSWAAPATASSREEALAYLGADLGVAGDGEAAFPALLERLEAREERLRHARGVHVDRVAAVDGSAASRRSRRPAARGTRPWIARTPRPRMSGSRCRAGAAAPTTAPTARRARIQGRTIRAARPGRWSSTWRALARAGLQRFYFVDNSFNIPESHALELCERWLRSSRRGVAWRCILYPAPGAARSWSRDGRGRLREVALGFESGCERILRAMNKRFTPDDVRRPRDLLAAHGIRRMGFLLLGGPGETRESVEESLAFAESLRLDALRITVGIRIYPGTPLARRAVQEGVITDEGDLL